MSFVKGTALFLAGGFTVTYLLAKAFEDCEKYPYAEKIEFENDNIRVIRLYDNPNCKIAVITRKKTETSEPEEVTTEES